MKTVYLGIGSNMGNALTHCTDVVSALHESAGCQVSAVSGWYASEPWGDTQQNWFTNGVVRLLTAHTPACLLTLCKSLEKQIGRVKTRRWGPRIIDIDILLWSGKIVISNNLQIPHSRLHQRKFVLQPFCDLAPDALHPLLGKSIAELLSDVNDPLRVIPIDSNWRFET